MHNMRKMDEYLLLLITVKEVNYSSLNVINDIIMEMNVIHSYIFIM